MIVPPTSEQPPQIAVVIGLVSTETETEFSRHSDRLMSCKARSPARSC